MNYKPYPKHKPSNIQWLGDIPSHWEVFTFRRISNLYKKTNNDNIDRPNLSLSSYRGIEYKKFEHESQRGTKKDYLPYNVVLKNQLVVNPMWVINGSIAVSQLEGIVSPAYRVYNLEKNVFPQYLNHLMRSDQYIYEYNKYIRGLTTYDRSVRKEDFHKIPIILPPLTEQHAIAAFLDRKTKEIDSFLETKKNLIAVLKEQKAAIINDAVTGRAVGQDIYPDQQPDPDQPRKPSGIEWLGDLPSHWEVKKVSRSFKTIGSGTTPTSGLDQYYKNGTIDWINTGDLNDGFLESCNNKITANALKDFTALKIFPKNSIIIALYGATIGKVSLTTFDACVNQACCVLNDSPFFTEKFILYWFIINRPHIVRLSYGGGQPNISQVIIKNLKIICPPLAEQHAIVAYIEKEMERIDYIIQQTEKEMELMKEYKQALISEAVTGKIRVE